MGNAWQSTIFPAFDGNKLFFLHVSSLLQSSLQGAPCQMYFYSLDTVCSVRIKQVSPTLQALSCAGFFRFEHTSFQRFKAAVVWPAQLKPKGYTESWLVSRLSPLLTLTLHPALHDKANVMTHRWSGEQGKIPPPHFLDLGVISSTVRESKFHVSNRKEGHQVFVGGVNRVTHKWPLLWDQLKHFGWCSLWLCDALPTDMVDL